MPWSYPTHQQVPPAHLADMVLVANKACSTLIGAGMDTMVTEIDQLPKGAPLLAKVGMSLF
jgi:hypothetical protein